MNMTHDEMIAVIQADKDGLPVEWTYKNGTQWRNRSGRVDLRGNINFQDNDYRVKPSPKYRPWTRDEVPVGAVVKWNNGDRSVISATSKNGVWIGSASHATRFEDIVANNTLEDGTPCGVLEGGDQ